MPDSFPEAPAAPAQPFIVQLQATPPVPQPTGLSLTSMILGLASIFFGWTFVAPALALVFGILGLKREPAGRGMAVTGVVIGGLFLLGWALIVLLFMLGVIAAASSSTYY